MREPSTRKPSEGGRPVGEKQNQPFQLSFNRFLHVDFQVRHINASVTTTFQAVYSRLLNQGDALAAL
jgi:hypothetical protein